MCEVFMLRFSCLYLQTSCGVLSNYFLRRFNELDLEFLHSSSQFRNPSVFRVSHRLFFFFGTFIIDDI